MPYPASKMITLRTSRDTLGLLVAASAMTFALAHAVHSRDDQATAVPATVQTAPAAPVERAWAGNLAEVEPVELATPNEPMTSAALVVPKSQLALPSVSARSLAKLRGCQDVSCIVAKAGQPVPARRPVVAVQPRAEPQDPPKRTLMARLNPLNHLPDVSLIGRPFAYAGDAISGWIKRF